ncbi:MAG: glycosyltransferase [Verrucomicrobia bacterium]|nr:glycosyltransferase [Verrucomicrobiota bacterium]
MKHKIRVLHLIDSLDLGGAQTLLLEGLPRFDPHVYDVTLAAFHANARTVFLKRARQAGIRTVALSPYRTLPLYVVTLPALLVTGRFDVVHCHLYASNWLGKPLARWLGVPVVIGHDHCFDAFRFEAPWRQLDRWSAAFADLTFVISSSIARRLVEREGVDPARLLVLQNGFAAPLTKPPKRHAAPAGLRWIGAAGRLVNWKRFDRFLVLAKALSGIDDRYRFALVGDGPARARLQAMAQHLGLGTRVIWPGAVPALRGFFGRIDAFVLTSDLEDVPMVLLEAFASRVPTATLAVNQERKQLTRETLLLDPQATAECWARDLDALLHDGSRCDRMADAAQQSLVSRFSLARQILTMDAHYRRLLRGKS